MASFLADENIPRVVVEQVIAKAPSARFVRIQSWRNGALLGVDDERILLAAYEDGLTLVTFDLRTIRPLLKRWAEEETPHAGVVLIDDKSIATTNIGGIVMAILDLWKRTADLDLTNSVQFLTRAAQD